MCDTRYRTRFKWLLLGMCSLLAPLASIGQTYYDNETLNSSQDPTIETRRSDHFRSVFGSYNRDTGIAMSESLAQGNLQMCEFAWNRWVNDMGFRDINESSDPAYIDGKKYRANWVYLMTFNDDGGGGAYMATDPHGFAWAMGNTSMSRLDPPSTVHGHEFGHCWEGTSAGFNDTTSSGKWWECTANWMSVQVLDVWSDPGTLVSNSMYYPAHGRDYYHSFPIWDVFKEDPRYGYPWIQRMWRDATTTQRKNEFIIDRMIRLDASGSPDHPNAIKDKWGEYAKKMVTLDFERQFQYMRVNKPDTDWSWYRGARAVLIKQPGADGWYRISREHTPMQFGYNIIPLTVTDPTVSCNFQPICDPVRQSDWRACLVAVNTSGDARYSNLWNMGTNSITLSADEDKVYLVVIATPKPMAGEAWNEYRQDSGSQFPYRVSFTHATPKSVVYVKPGVDGTYRRNPDGTDGGFVQTGAVVDSTAYVGPNAMVLDYAQVKNNARIEDYAVVRNSAQVRDNAVVSGHAVVQDTAKVYGNAKVRDWAMVSGNAQVYENARVIEHGTVADNGNVVYGSAVVKGTSYVYSPSTLSGSVICDGDTANGGTGTRGVHFGWQWSQTQSIFDGLTDNAYIYAQHTFEKDHPVWAWDEYGINHGFLMNGCHAAIDTVNPKRGGRVLPLDGVSQYVELHNSVNDWKDTAISVWAKWTGTNADQKIWSMGDGDKKYMYLTPKDGITGNLTFVISDGTTTQTLNGNATMSPNTWTHVAVVFSGGTSTLYVNGTSVASNSASILPDKINAPFMENCNYLGKGNTGDFFKGSVDDFRVYSKALTASEVSNVYTSTLSVTAITPPAADVTAPTPSKSTWLVPPVAVSNSAVTMSATPGTDASGWVEYNFKCTSGNGHDSGWVSFNRYTDCGLTPDMPYTYTVMMRDKSGNTPTPSDPASVTTGAGNLAPTPNPASFAYGPVGTTATSITMTATKGSSADELVEYNFTRVYPADSVASSGWRSASTWTDTGLTAGSTYGYTVQMKDSKGNKGEPSAIVMAVARDDAAPTLVIPFAQWETPVYATIDNKLSMTAMATKTEIPTVHTDPSGVEYFFHCVSGGGPDSNWQSSPKYTTGTLPDGTYVYEYKIRDGSPQHNETPYSIRTTATISPYRGYHNYALTQLASLPDDTLPRFTGTVTQVSADSYVVTDTSSNTSIKVVPSTYGRVTDPSLIFKEVTVSGHLWTFAGVRTVTFATVTATGGGTTLVISGRVTNAAGSAIAGAKVYFSASPNASANPACTATTNSQGAFSRTIINGTWYVSVSADEYYPSADQTVTVNGASVPNVNFVLNLAPKVTGRVTDIAGVGISGATVYFAKTAGAITNVMYKATTDSRGNYTKGLADGTWYIAASAMGYSPSADRTLTAAGSPISGIDFALNLGGDGLKGEYFDNNNLTTLKMTRVDPVINFDWSNIAPDSSMGTSDWSVRWTGQIKPKYSQTYTFYTTSDDGVRLWVNDQLLIDNWTVHGATENSGTIALTANQWAKIKLEYYQGGGGAVIKLEWSSSSQGRQIIPQSQLWSGSTPGYLAYGKVTDSAGSPLAGATVFFSASPNASTGYTYTATSDFQGNYSKIVPNGSWYVAAGKSNYITSADKSITMASANVAGINFSLVPMVVPVDVFYKFDETSGVTALDSSGNGKNGTLANGPTWVRGRIGGAVEFDGVDDCVMMPALMDYNAITVAGWVNMDSFGTDATGCSIVSSDGSVSGGLKLMVVKATGQLRLSIVGNSPAQVDSGAGFTSADFGKWRHVAAVYESAPGTVKFYINGGLVSTKSFGASRSALLSNALRVGGWSDGSFFDGKIDDFRIYARALSGSEIVDLVAGGAEQSIGAAKKMSDGELVAFGSKPVTYAPRNSSSARGTSHFYIEEPNKSAGIRVSDGLTGQDDVTVDYAASVAGFLRTDTVTGERFLELSGLPATGAASKASPIGMNTKSAIDDPIAVGLLARVSGKVVDVAPDATWFTMTDGYKNDATSSVKVVLEAGQKISGISAGNIVVVNGIVSKEAGAQNPVRVILMRERTRLVPPESTAFAHYRFDEVSGNVVVDASGNNRNATLVNGPTLATGKYGNAINLDGTNDYVSLQTGILSAVSNCTIATWVKLDTNSDWNRIFDFGTGTSTNMFLTPRASSGTIRFAIRANGGGEQQINGTAALPTGSWQHVAVTISGSTGRLYVNGVQVGQNTSMSLKPSSLGNTSQNYIGKSQYNDPYMDGLVDDFRIFDKPLSATEVQQLYNGQLY